MLRYGTCLKIIQLHLKHITFLPDGNVGFPRCLHTLTAGDDGMSRIHSGLSFVKRPAAQMNTVYTEENI